MSFGSVAKRLVRAIYPNVDVLHTACSSHPFAGLPPPLRQDWRLLFNSARHGMSYSTFLGRLGQASPTLLLLRDKGGAVFGGIAHAPWQKTGTFYGESGRGLLDLCRVCFC